MPGRMQVFAKYGVAYDLYFTLASPAVTDDDKFVSGSIAGLPIVAGDVTISKDGGAVASTTNLPTQITAAQPHYKLILTATEMQATLVSVVFQDQTGSAAWRSLHVAISTRLNLGQLSIDATAIGGNANAIEATGVGASSGATFVAGATGSGVTFRGGATSGHGFHCDAQTSGHGILLTPRGNTGISIMESKAGADFTGSVLGIIRSALATAGAAGSITLDASASTTNDFYNEMQIAIINGTGVGQVRMITDYTGSSQVALVNRDWTVTPDATTQFLITRGPDVWDCLEGAEPTGAPAANTTPRRMLQYLKRRFFNKVTQTAAQQKIHLDDDSTTLTTMSCSDDGTTQTKGEAT